MAVEGRKRSQKDVKGCRKLRKGNVAERSAGKHSDVNTLTQEKSSGDRPGERLPAQLSRTEGRLEGYCREKHIGQVRQAWIRREQAVADTFSD